MAYTAEEAAALNAALDAGDSAAVDRIAAESRGEPIVSPTPAPAPEPGPAPLVATPEPAYNPATDPDSAFFNPSGLTVDTPLTPSTPTTEPIVGGGPVQPPPRPAQEPIDTTEALGTVQELAPTIQQISGLLNRLDPKVPSLAEQFNKDVADGKVKFAQIDIDLARKDADALNRGEVVPARGETILTLTRILQYGDVVEKINDVRLTAQDDATLPDGTPVNIDRSAIGVSPFDPITRYNEAVADLRAAAARQPATPVAPKAAASEVAPETPLSQRPIGEPDQGNEFAVRGRDARLTPEEAQKLVNELPQELAGTIGAQVLLESRDPEQVRADFEATHIQVGPDQYIEKTKYLEFLKELSPDLQQRVDEIGLLSTLQEAREKNQFILDQLIARGGPEDAVGDLAYRRFLGAKADGTIPKKAEFLGVDGSGNPVIGGALLDKSVKAIAGADTLGSLALSSAAPFSDVAILNSAGKLEAQPNAKEFALLARDSLPIIGTITTWKASSNLGRAIRTAGDVLLVAPIVKGPATAAARALATEIKVGIGLPKTPAITLTDLSDEAVARIASQFKESLPVGVTKTTVATGDAPVTYRAPEALSAIERKALIDAGVPVDSALGRVPTAQVSPFTTTPQAKTVGEAIDKFIDRVHDAELAGRDLAGRRQAEIAARLALTDSAANGAPLEVQAGLQTRLELATAAREAAENTFNAAKIQEVSYGSYTQRLIDDAKLADPMLGKGYGEGVVDRTALRADLEAARRAVDAAVDDPTSTAMLRAGLIRNLNEAEAAFNNAGRGVSTSTKLTLEDIRNQVRGAITDQQYPTVQSIATARAELDQAINLLGNAQEPLTPEGLALTDSVNRQVAIAAAKELVKEKQASLITAQDLRVRELSNEISEYQQTYKAFGKTPDQAEATLRAQSLGSGRPGGVALDGIESWRTVQREFDDAYNRLSIIRNTGYDGPSGSVRYTIGPDGSGALYITPKTGGASGLLGSTPSGYGSGNLGLAERIAAETGGGRLPIPTQQALLDAGLPTDAVARAALDLPVTPVTILPPMRFPEDDTIASEIDLNKLSLEDRLALGGMSRINREEYFKKLASAVGRTPQSVPGIPPPPAPVAPTFGAPPAAPEAPVAPEPLVEPGVPQTDIPEPFRRAFPIGPLPPPIPLPILPPEPEPVGPPLPELPPAISPGEVPTEPTPLITPRTPPTVEPTIEPTPIPDPLRRVQPMPEPAPGPEPIREPFPTPRTTPSPLETPAPQPQPQPSPSPSPAPAPAPQPSPTGLPWLDPLPMPLPIPSALPTPQPMPQPQPIPTPTPAPMPQPQPAPVPEMGTIPKLKTTLPPRRDDDSRARLGDTDRPRLSTEPTTSRYARVATFLQGNQWKIVDLDTGAIVSTLVKPPQVPPEKGRGSPQRTYTVIGYDESPPTGPRVIPLGKVFVIADGNGLRYRARNTLEQQMLDAARAIKRANQGPFRRKMP